MTLALDRFLDPFLRHPDRQALVDLTGAATFSLTYGQTLATASAIAARLMERGVSPGDRVAAMLPNGIDSALVYLACLVGGFTIVPLNPQSPDSVLTHALELVRPRLTVCRPDAAERVSGTVWAVEAADLLAPGPATDIRGADSARLAIFFTSGTASRPKGVCHRTGGMLANVMAFNAANGLGPATRMLHVMPMSYMAGFLNTILSPLAAGGTVLIAPPFGAASALSFWQTAKAGEANAVWLTPTMLALLSQVTRDPAAPAWAAANLSHVFAGTAPLPPSVRGEFEARFGVRCRESYGMTEVLLVAAQDPSSSPGTVGRPLPGIAMRARAEDGRDLDMGCQGELWIDSPFAFSGYLDPETGADPTADVAGWFPTGDVGFLDDAGELFITDRKKDILIRGGTNISPRAVEEALRECAGISDVAVIGLAHPFWGEEVAAIVELQPGATMGEVRAEAARHCAQRLPADALPTRWQVVAELPRSSTGKIQKGGLKALFT